MEAQDGADCTRHLFDVPEDVIHTEIFDGSSKAIVSGNMNYSTFSAVCLFCGHGCVTGGSHPWMADPSANANNELGVFLYFLSHSVVCKASSDCGRHSPASPPGFE